MYMRGYNPSPGQKKEIKYKMWHVTNGHKVMSEQAEINECQETRSSKDIMTRNHILVTK